MSIYIFLLKKCQSKKNKVAPKAKQIHLEL